MWGTIMTNNYKSIANDYSENCCFVCCKNVDVQSIGPCEHSVCFECSTRLRVICNSYECPMCRQENSQVIFTPEIKPYDQLAKVYNDEKLADIPRGIYFSSYDVKERYERLLENRCKICKETSVKFPSLVKLEEHLKREHELYFCPLCVANLKLFPTERRCYLKSELKVHNRFGDLEDSSYSGHSLCELCNAYFLDSYDLHCHKRRNHYYCHFCDDDGNDRHFISSNELYQHFEKKHYICREGQCQNRHMSSAFKSEIEYKFHTISMHGKNLSKKSCRRTRNLTSIAQKSSKSFVQYYNDRNLQQQNPIPSQIIASALKTVERIGLEENSTSKVQLIDQFQAFASSHTFQPEHIVASTSTKSERVKSKVLSNTGVVSPSDFKHDTFEECIENKTIWKKRLEIPVNLSLDSPVLFPHEGNEKKSDTGKTFSELKSLQSNRKNKANYSGEHSLMSLLGINKPMSKQNKSFEAAVHRGKSRKVCGLNNNKMEWYHRLGFWRNLF